MANTSVKNNTPNAAQRYAGMNTYVLTDNHTSSPETIHNNGIQYKFTFFIIGLVLGL